MTTSDGGDNLVARALESVLDAVPAPPAEGAVPPELATYQPWADTAAPSARGKRPLQALLDELAERIAAEPQARASRPGGPPPMRTWLDRFAGGGGGRQAVPGSGRRSRRGRGGRADESLAPAAAAAPSAPSPDAGDPGARSRRRRRRGGGAGGGGGAPAVPSAPAGTAAQRPPGAGPRPGAEGAPRPEGTGRRRRRRGRGSRGGAGAGPAE